MNEIAKLPSGVAVVYQNDWVSPVLTMIDKADVEEGIYVSENKKRIRTVSSARLLLLRMLMQPWLGKKKIEEQDLVDSLKVLDISRSDKRRISELIKDYSLFNGMLSWNREDLPVLKKLVQAVLGITEKDFARLETADDLRRLVSSRVKRCSQKEINDICYILTVQA